MFRRTAPRLTFTALVTATAVFVAVPAGAVSPKPIRVFDVGYDESRVRVQAGDTVRWELDPGAQSEHTVTSNQDGGFHHRFTPGVSTVFERKFDTPGTFGYVCLVHGNQMVGVIEVAENPPPPPPPTTTTTTEPPATTTTTAPPPTTTTTAPPPTTTTTRPRPTTTTTRPPATAPTTSPPPASASDDDPDTTDTTARATTTSGKPTTTTTGKKKPGSTTTTKPPETTTSTAPAPALPTEWIPTPDIVPDDSSTTTTTTDPDTEAAASHKPKGGKGGGDDGFPTAGAAVLGLIVLGGAGWGWYHRGSRYLPA